MIVRRPALPPAKIKIAPKLLKHPWKTDNPKRKDSNLPEPDQQKDQVSSLDEEMKKLRSESENTQNRGLTKTATH